MAHSPAEQWPSYIAPNHGPFSGMSSLSTASSLSSSTVGAGSDTGPNSVGSSSSGNLAGLTNSGPDGLGVGTRHRCSYGLPSFLARTFRSQSGHFTELMSPLYPDRRGPAPILLGPGLLLLYLRASLMSRMAWRYPSVVAGALTVWPVAWSWTLTVPAGAPVSVTKMTG